LAILPPLVMLYAACEHVPATTEVFSLSTFARPRLGVIFRTEREKKGVSTILMRVLIFVLSYIGIFLVVAVTHIVGLWTYPKPLTQSAENFSVDILDNASSPTTSSSPGAAEMSSSKETPRASGTTPRESSPIVTSDGYVVATRCALWSVEGFDLYYSPADPSTVCVQPPDSTVRAEAPHTSRSAQMPLNCAVAPDSAVYCLIGGQLTRDTLKAFYDRGELQTPKVPSVGEGEKRDAVEEAWAPDSVSGPTQST